MLPKADHADIDAVFDRLWDVHREEWKRINVTVDTMRQRAYRIPISYVARIDGVPECFYGLEINGSEGYTWFLATDRFSTHWKRLTRLMKKELPRECAAQGLRRVLIYAVEMHPKQGLWYQLMGFKRAPNRDCRMGQTHASAYIYEV